MAGTPSPGTWHDAKNNHTHFNHAIALGRLTTRPLPVWGMVPTPCLSHPPPPPPSLPTTCVVTWAGATKITFLSNYPRYVTTLRAHSPAGCPRPDSNSERRALAGRLALGGRGWESVVLQPFLQSLSLSPFPPQSRSPSTYSQCTSRRVRGCTCTCNNNVTQRLPQRMRRIDL